MATGNRRLIVIVGLLGDFDSFEYGQILASAFCELEKKNIQIIAIGIGNEDSARRFSFFEH